MKFGCFTPQGWRMDLMNLGNGFDQYQRLKELTLEIERLEFDSVWLYDHFHTVPEARPEATFEVWSTTAALAEATTTIRLGQMCGCNFYRPPALLAKMTSVIDCISNGRLEFGLGAGWYQHEAVAYGYSFDRPSVRIGMLDEAVQIIKGMWTEERFQFQGKYYKVGLGEVKDYSGCDVSLNGAVNHPKPIQNPHPPLWIAAGGEQLTLRTVARYANYSNFAGSLETVQHKNRVLDDHCHKIGRDPSEITRSMNVYLSLHDPAELRKILGDAGKSEADIEAMTVKVLFSHRVDEVTEQLCRYRDEARIDYMIFYFLDIGRGESLQRFVEEVRPGL